MRTLIFTLSILAGCLNMQAQKYLLPDFKSCIAISKNNGRPIQEKFNYNCETQTMEFLDGEYIMKLDPISQIDTLYLDTHKMIPYGTHFLEVIYVSNKFSLLVDHKRKAVNQGKTGAMGLKTQGTVENVDFSSFGGRHTEEWKKGNEVWKYKDESTYVYTVKSKMKRFRNVKMLVKIFPEKEEEIKTYIRTHDKFGFEHPDEVLNLLLFLQ